MSEILQFHEVARLPMPQDNVAIAVRRIEAEATIQDGDRTYVLTSTVLEGHRFAVAPITAGQPLLSWELPFGIATRDIAPGEYVCNQGVLDELATRRLTFEPVATPNFRDAIAPYVLDNAAFTPAQQVARYDEDATFLGYARGAGRGVGTRNYIVLLGTTSLTGSFVRQLEARLKDVAKELDSVDGIVAVAHTEGAEKPNNLEFVLRTLAGFMVHPNVAAVMAFDYGIEPINNRMLRSYMAEHDYPLHDLPHRFASLTGSFLQDLDEAEAQVRGWLPAVAAQRRTPQSAEHLRLALQCGGSDAFSGISGNPLVAWVARELIRYGGAANLAETDELIGAEPYILQRVRDLDTAHRFLEMIERFQQRVGWHGHTAEGNPGGGNKYRGLYNINLKSIGAARKKNPDVRLDYVLDYAERMTAPGYYFMNSPGNDIESIAGQIASGSNLITFVTGNGSVTNFPFVPTIKVVTTTRRFQLLQHDMDVNAGAYLDGTSMDDLGRDAFSLTLEVASGKRSVGERAGHSQVQLWRNWRQTDTSRVQELEQSPLPAGRSIPLATSSSAAVPDIRLPVRTSSRGVSWNKVGLIVPTSLCSSEVAKIAAMQLNEAGLGRQWGLERFVALTSTEGCGNSSGASEELYVRTLLGYAMHPAVERCLFLEHGCEKTHNEYIRQRLLAAGQSPSDFGWASIQMDGGIDAALETVAAWFRQSIDGTHKPENAVGDLGALCLALASMEPVDDGLARALAELTLWVVEAGGVVVVPQNATLLSNAAYSEPVLGDRPHAPSLAYGAPLPESEHGFHIMEAPTAHWVETLTGLGATGVECIAAAVNAVPVQGHPLVPVLQFSVNNARMASDVDLHLTGAQVDWPNQMLNVIGNVAGGTYTPKLRQFGNIDFQITRGLLGVSM